MPPSPPTSRSSSSAPAPSVSPPPRTPRRAACPAVVLEAGDGPGAAVREWGHVRLFSAWSELVDPAAEALLAGTGWQRPDPATYPTGAEWVDAYLAPLAEALAATAEVEVRYGHRVVGVAKQGRDRMVDSGREDAPFTVHVRSERGHQPADRRRRHRRLRHLVRRQPAGRRRAPGARRGRARRPHHLRHPGLHRPRHPRPLRRQAGRGGRPRRLGPEHPGRPDLSEPRKPPTPRSSGSLRRPGLDDAFGGGDNDQLEARGALGKRAQAAVEGGPVQVVTSFRTAEVTTDRGRPNDDRGHRRASGRAASTRSSWSPASAPTSTG